MYAGPPPLILLQWCRSCGFRCGASSHTFFDHIATPVCNLSVQFSFLWFCLKLLVQIRKKPGLIMSHIRFCRTSCRYHMQQSLTVEWLQMLHFLSFWGSPLYSEASWKKDGVRACWLYLGSLAWVLLFSIQNGLDISPALKAEGETCGTVMNCASRCLLNLLGAELLCYEGGWPGMGWEEKKMQN